MVALRLIKPAHLWYVVGLIATDGNLSKDGRHVCITSKDRIILEEIKEALGLQLKIGAKGNGSSKEKIYSVLQIGSVDFYRFLLGIGLTKKKSLTLGKLKIPKKFFIDFFRGVIDGDGSINSWIHRGNGNKQWALKIVSGSKEFLDWLQQEVAASCKIDGRLHVQRKAGRNPLFSLKFGKFGAKIVLRKCYYDGCLAIPRKLQSAAECITSKNGLSRYGEFVAT